MATSVSFILKEPLIDYKSDPNKYPKEKWSEYAKENSRRSKIETLIFLFFRFNYYTTSSEGKKKYTTLRISTGEKINPKYWESHPIYRGKSIRDVFDATELNQRLTNIETATNDIYRRLVNNGEIVTPERMKNELNRLEYLFPNRATKRIKKSYESKPETNFIPFIENFINIVKVVYKRGTPYPVNHRTKQKYTTTLKILKEFSAESRLTRFDQIDRDFYEKFITYLQNAKWYSEEIDGKLITKGYSQNTIGKFIANLKTFLQQATEAGINTTLDFKNRKFAVPSEDVEKIYLRESELMEIYKLNLSDSKGMEAVRDLFLVGCYTALRYSDYTNIKPENIVQSDSGTTIKINTQKTGQRVVIPLHWIVREILQKYDNQLPCSISNQKTNEHLKQIGKKAGITEKISITKTIGGITRTITRPKYELITTHTARRTGATNMYLSGIPVHSIMKITGHKTESSFLRYLRFDEEDNARILQSNPYFQAKRKLKIV
jgi:integrase